MIYDPRDHDMGWTTGNMVAAFCVGFAAGGIAASVVIALIS